MTTPEPVEKAPSLTEHTITVLLVDDQAMIGEAVRRMLADQPDIEFHFLSDPTKALQVAAEVNPTVILQDLVMPEIDGLKLVQFFRAGEKTRDVPMIVLSSKEEPKVKAEAFALGANDYLVKLPDAIELIARIRYHSQGYIHRLQRNEAYRKLQASQKQLADDVAQAANYVESLLPEPLTGELNIDWRFVPSAQLGGDSFGYHWLDDDHFAIYLLDVCGHGVGAALLSVSAMNVLRSQTLPKTDFRDPAQVLSGLNNSFKMEEQNNMYFTIWYGVYRKSERKLVYCGGGHPPALLFTGPDAQQARTERLDPSGMMIGAFPEMEYESSECQLDAYACMYVFSDGCYEISKQSGEMWTIREFIEYMEQASRAEGNTIEMLIAHDRALGGSDNFEDDFSMIEVRFS